MGTKRWGTERRERLYLHHKEGREGVRGVTCERDEGASDIRAVVTRGEWSARARGEWPLVSSQAHVRGGQCWSMVTRAGAQWSAHVSSGHQGGERGLRIGQSAPHHWSDPRSHWTRDFTNLRKLGGEIVTKPRASAAWPVAKLGGCLRDGVC